MCANVRATMSCCAVGVTKAEADYIGVNEFLDDYFGNGNKTITKAELDEFIESRQFKIEVKINKNDQLFKIMKR